MGGIYTVIRSKVPITRKEYGNNYLCLGPYNDLFVKTEVEVSEPKIDVICEAVQEMKHFGVNVSIVKTKKQKDFIIFIEKCYRL